MNTRTRTRLRTASISIAAAAALSLGAPLLSAGAATLQPAGTAATTGSTGSIVLSGTVTDARAEHTSGGVIQVPDSTPAVAGATIKVNGTTVGTSDGTGAFAIDYADPDGAAVTVTVTAPGFGAYRLTGLTPAHSGDSLTVQLTHGKQTLSDDGAPAKAPGNKNAVDAHAGSTASGAATSSGTITPGTMAPAASGPCGGYSSNSTPPSTIRVLEYSQHTSSGAPVAGTESGVYSVSFETYVKDVLPNEWISSWDSDSLEAGAMAAKTYAWYWINNWRGGSYGGNCYNVDDSIDYQRFIPGQSAGSTDSAVEATWDTVMTKSGSIFEASYQATLTGSSSEGCGSGLSNYPNTLSQWGSENCAVDGDSWKTILSTYYPGISLSGGSNFGTVSMDAAGDKAAYVNSSGAVVNDWVSGSSWTGPAGLGGTARADSPVVEDAAGDHVFFIEPDGSVANDWHESDGWHGPALIGGTARAGSGLSTNAAGTMVAFANSSGQVVNDWVSNGAWSGPAGMGGYARADSPIVLDAKNDHVYFINSSGQIANDWVSNGAWSGPALLGGSARAGSGLTTTDAGNLVGFVDTSGQVVNDYQAGGVGGAWTGPAGLGGTARANSPLLFDSTGAHIYFFDKSNNVTNDWNSGSGWSGPAAIGGTARAGSGLTTTSAGNLVGFVNGSGQVVNDYHNDSGWNGPAGLGGTSR